MPSIIRDLPYFDQATRVQVLGRPFSVKRDQIVVWISITEQGIQEFDPRVPRFPGIAVYPAKEGQPLYPRLPLVGLRAFRRAGLHLAIDCRRSLVRIRTPRRFRLFV